MNDVQFDFDTMSETIETVESLGSSETGPEVMTATDGLFDSLIQRRELGVIVGITGGHKTNCGLNIVAYAAKRGMKVLVLNADMDVKKAKSRLKCILSDYPIDKFKQPGNGDECRRILNDPTVSKSLAAVTFCDLSLGNYGPEAWIGLINQSFSNTASPPDVIYVDGSERVSADFNYQQAIEKLYTGLVQLAAEHNASVWVTSQIKADGDGKEILGKEHAAFSRDKACRSSMVLTIGSRIEGCLLTVCLDKNRNGGDSGKNVHRLMVMPSLQLRVMTAEADRLKCCSEAASEIVTIGVEKGDIPFDSDPEQDGLGADESTSQQPLLKPFHGTNGFIPIGRNISQSPFYQNRDWGKIGLLTDLYAMAQFQPGDRHAPNTTTPVHLERGEVMVSLAILSKRWGIGESRIRVFLDRARKDGLISIVKVMADGRRIPVIGSVDDGKTTFGTTSRSICQVVKCLHYPAKITKEEE